MEIKIEDIEDAMRELRNSPRMHIVENELCIFEYSDLGLETVRLKPEGKRLVDEFVNMYPRKEVKNAKIETLFGVKVIISEDVKGVELR